MSKTIMMAAVALMLPGCASTLGYVLNPSISSDKLDEPREDNKLKAMKGDPRLIRTHRVSTTKYPSDDFEVCAETFADAISARSGTFKASLEGKAGLDDSLTEVLTKTLDRSPLSDVVRHLHWYTCNAAMNRWIDNATYTREMVAIRENAFLVLLPRDAAPKSNSEPLSSLAKVSEVSTTSVTTTKTK